MGKLIIPIILLTLIISCSLTKTKGRESDYGWKTEESRASVISFSTEEGETLFLTAK